MSIAIVILNFNGIHYLQRFLPEVIANSPEGQVYVIDNASQDASLAWLQTQYPNIPCICLEKNLGYAGGYQAGLASIPADWFVLMNSDLAPGPGWLKHLLEYQAAHPNTKALQPYIRSLEKAHAFEYAGAAGGMLDDWGYAFCRGRLFDTLENDEDQYPSGPIHWASGACLMVEAKAYWAVGGLDPYFFAHQEEIDLCCRLRRAGHEIAAVRESKVWHLGGGTLNKVNSQKTFLNFRNNLVLIHKNWGDRKRLVLWTRLFLDGLAGIKFLLEGKPKHTWAIVRAHFAFYAYLISGPRPQAFESKQALSTWKGCILIPYFLKGKRSFFSLRS